MGLQFSWGFKQGSIVKIRAIFLIARRSEQMISIITFCYPVPYSFKLPKVNLNAEVSFYRSIKVSKVDRPVNCKIFRI